VKTKVVFETTIEFPIKVEQYSNGSFKVTYGDQVDDDLNYVDAAKELGLSIFHGLASQGKLDGIE
jgi:hypothetical protein